jgi:Ca2+-binding EF-hand superfamily protein
LHLREAFKIFDRRRTGFISIKELRSVTSMLGATLSPEELEEFMQEADLVRSGSKECINDFNDFL